MLRRSVRDLAYRRSIWRTPRQNAVQCAPPLISSARSFSTESQNNTTPKPGPSENPPTSSKFLLGSALIAGALFAAYSNGHLDQYLGGKQHVPLDIGKDDNKEEKNVQNLGVQEFSSTAEELGKSNSVLEHPKQDVETQTDLPQLDVPKETQDQEQSNVDEKADELVEEGKSPTLEKGKTESYQISKDISHSQNDEISSEMIVDKIDPKNAIEVMEEALSTAADDRSSAPPEESNEEQSKESPVSLLETYNLREQEEQSKETKAFATADEEKNEVYFSKDGKLVLDFLQAIHAAEKRQAELDADAFSKEIKALKEKYEKELRDLRARELMRTEEAAMLDKELKRERTKAAAAIKSLQEKMEEKLKLELEQKEREAELQLQKAEELAKAELAAAIAKEKAAQIEKMAEADLHINALCMAFYARSEEQRKSHSVHKLALGALALEDALSKGLPIQKEIDALRIYLGGIEKESVLDLVLSSLPEETRLHGTDTTLKLNQKSRATREHGGSFDAFVLYAPKFCLDRSKAEMEQNLPDSVTSFVDLLLLLQFNALKGTLRHFSLIPPGGGGILTHSLAQIASWLKVKEVDDSGEGIESTIGRVEKYLAEGKLAEAATALEDGVRGSQAEEIIGDWVRQARNRAITEQALTVLQSYATCISLT